VSDIIFAKPEDMRPAPSKGAGRRDTCISMLVKNEDRLVAVLDLPALFPDYTVQQQGTSRQRINRRPVRSPQVS
jgi:chemotaxis signal transduction protein